MLDDPQRHIFITSINWNWKVVLDDPQMHIFIANINWNWKVVFAVFLMSIILMGSQIEAIHFMLLMFEAAFGLCQNERENERLDRWALSLGNLSLISNRNSRPFPCDFWDITGPNSWFYFYGMWVFKCWRRPVVNLPFKRMSSLFTLQDENIDHFPCGKFKSMQNITFLISKTII